MAGGPTPYYTNPEEMQEKVDAYFAWCAGHPLELPDPKTGELCPVYDKYGQPVIADGHPPTVTGLALALGFASRTSLLNYQHKAGFEEVVTRAKSRVEQYTEERLFDREGVQGAKFSLANNFKGWVEKQDINMGNQEGAPFEVNIKVVE